uniref:Uncharacterized protein n=1 Tax=viral metagenome TaxID=1070528 RepID=A0A6C0CSF5_9ZZZZ
MDRQILENCKDYIETDQLDELKSYIYNLIHFKDTIKDYRLPIEYLYQQIYLHACLKKKHSIAEWLKGIFTMLFDEIQQIGLRQMFSYGNYLLNK